MPAKPLSTTTLAVLDLELAWRRLRADVGERGFVIHPWLGRWLSSDLTATLEVLRDELARGYQPVAAQRCWEPKPGWLLRPGSVLEVRDEVAYTAMVGALIPALRQELRWAQPDHPDAAYVLATTDRAIRRSGAASEPGLRGVRSRWRFSGPRSSWFRPTSPGSTTTSTWDA